jgi:serine/threonine protein kinase
MDADAWRQAKSVLEAALLCAPAERAAFVAGRCTDPWLRNEVLACLNEHDESFLESALTISHTFDQASSSDHAEPPPELHPGDHVGGRYAIIRRLGAGGMGHVFLATDMELDRQVALKFLVVAASAEDIRARIFHEARAAARLTHPNIAVVHDVGTHESRAFIVMEYVGGESLAQLLKHERPSLEKILSIARQLASALKVAHDRGIIHRDLKPANIQVAHDGSVKILDFGVAQAIAGVEPTISTTTATAPLSTLATLRTQRGTVRHPGTPVYMSPEQMWGKPLDQRSDIYTLGVILYEMATGHRPYSTEDPLDVVLALSHKLLRPSGAETHLPEAVNDIIGKMLTVDLDDRYQTAAAVESALTALTTPEPLVVVSPIRSKSWLQVVGRAALGLVVILAGFTTLGGLETSSFNAMLGRTGTRFDTESPTMWLVWGERSLLVPIIYFLLIFLVFSGARFMVRMLSRSKTVDGLLNTGLTRTTRLESRFNLHNPKVFGLAVSLAGMALLSTIFWYYWPFILAWGTRSIDTDPAQRFLPLRPTGRPRLDAQVYQFLLMFSTFAFGAAIAHIQRLRIRHSSRGGGAALALVGTMTVVAIVMCVYPYRVVWLSVMPRLDVAGERCFRIGEKGDQWLIHCPDRTVPRNRTIASTNPTIRDTGRTQSIFAPEEVLR